MEELLKEEIKEEGKTPNEATTSLLDEIEKIQPETQDAQLEATGDTLTPSDVPSLASTPQPTDEQIEDAKGQDQDGTNEDSENVDEVLEKLFSQSQVNELVGNARVETRRKTEEDTRAKVMQELFGRYGVNSDEELNDIFGKGQAYSVLNEDYTNRGNQLNQVMAENALLKSGITESRWDDAKAILSAKGLEINAENIANELITHPEWKQVGQEQKILTPAGAEAALNKPDPKEQTTPSVIRKLGIDVDAPKQNPSEDEQINKWFNL
jgi:hypothetical protein